MWSIKQSLRRNNNVWVWLSKQAHLQFTMEHWQLLWCHQEDCSRGRAGRSKWPVSDSDDTNMEIIGGWWSENAFRQQHDVVSCMDITSYHCRRPTIWCCCYYCYYYYSYYYLLLWFMHKEHEINTRKWWWLIIMNCNNNDKVYAIIHS